MPSPLQKLYRTGRLPYLVIPNIINLFGDTKYKMMGENMKRQTCCFTGHRKLPKEKIEQIVINLEREIESLIAQGVKQSHVCGGAL